ncbi:type 1 fimbrial protein [Pseudomonas sp. Irchel 3A5]|uniref:type 1 fimbrial protein n=1 Tax=Pseudomonas sp. Irchel 3A5 TaxID=2008911 RepID=UPI000BA46C2F|nr:type 1 fimbrial protein [Pseudomonas sp. Irchel 3A5]
MKRSVSSKNRWFEVIHEARKVASLLIVGSLCLTAFAASAADGRLSFSGYITNASCAVLSTSSAGGVNTQRVNVSGHMSIVVDTAQNACTASVIPFSTQYQALPVSLSKSNPSGAGVLTLTYQ